MIVLGDETVDTEECNGMTQICVNEGELMGKKTMMQKDGCSRARIAQTPS